MLAAILKINQREERVETGRLLRELGNTPV